MATWLQSLLAAFITGGANAASAMFIAPETFNLQNLKKVGAMFLVSGIFGVITFLKRSPLPNITNNINPISLLLIGALSLGVVSQTSCNSGDFKKVVQSARVISIAVTRAPVTLKSLHDKGLLPDDEYRTDLKIVRDMILIEDQFADLLSASSQIDSTNKAQYLSLVAQLAASLRVLLEEQALHIKNPDTKIAFDAIFTGAQTGALALEVFLTNLKGTVKVPPNAVQMIRAN